MTETNKTNETNETITETAETQGGTATDEPATDAPETEDKSKKKEKDPKRRELQKKLDALTADNKQLADALAAEKDRYARMLAEYENFRKRSQKEKDGVYADAYAEALGEIMPMVDNLERALQFSDGEKLKEGLQMVMNQFCDTLKKLGIEAYGEKGDTFDPNIHHAIMHEDDESQPENVITDVFQKGYRKGDKIIRCAMVKVVN